MSQENVEIARRAYEASNRGDFDGMVADFAPNFEYTTTGAIPGMTGVYRTAEGMAEFVEWMLSEFEHPRIEVRELIDAGVHVLGAVTLRGRGKQSGVETSWDLWHVWTVQHGKVVDGRAVLSKEDALEAAGLRE